MELPPGVTEADLLREIRNTTCTVQLDVHNCCYYVERKYKNALKSKGLPFDDDRRRQISDLISEESYAAYKKRYAPRESLFEETRTLQSRFRRHIFITKIKNKSIQTVCMESERNAVPNPCPENITNPNRTESIENATVSHPPDDSFAIPELPVTRPLGQDDGSGDSDTSEGTVVTVICTQ